MGVGCSKLRVTPPVVVVCGVAYLLSTHPAPANLIVNGDFEAPVVDSGVASFVSGAQLPGWTIFGTLALIDTHYAEPGNGMSAFNSKSGVQSIDITGPNNGAQRSD
jgi:hypothetical protein